MEINLPPFYVGQKVVALEDSLDGLFKKGDEFRVTSIKKCTGCNAWEITIGIATGYDFKRCVICNCLEIIKSEAPFLAKRFAPVEMSFQEISYSKVMEEEKKFVGVN